MKEEISEILERRKMYFSFGRLIFLLIILILIFVLFFVVPHFTFFSVEEKGIIDVPRVEEGKEIRYFGYKYSNTNGAVLSAPSQISCRWKSPDEDDGFKICEAVIEIEPPNDAYGLLDSPEVNVAFSVPNEVRNLEVLYSGSFHVVEEVKEESVLENVYVGEDDNDSKISPITGYTINSEDDEEGISKKLRIDNHNKIPELRIKKAIVKQKSESIRKRKFDNFFDLDEVSEITDKNETIEFVEEEFEETIEKNKSFSSNFSEDNLTATETIEETVNESMNEGVNGAEILGSDNKSIEENESRSVESENTLEINNETSEDNESLSNETLKDESLGDENQESSQDLIPEDESNENSSDSSIDNLEEEIILDEVEITYKDDESVLSKLSGYIIDESNQIELSNPFAVKIRFEIPKYSENNFDFGLTTGNFEGYLDPYVSGCGDLTAANSVYSLDQDVNSSGTCFNINADNITLDCQGNKISYSEFSLGYGVYSSSSYTKIRNCVIESMNSSVVASKGIYFNNVVGGNISNNTILQSNSQGHAIFLDGCENSIITSNRLNVNSSSQGIYGGGSSSGIIIEGNSLYFEGEEGYSGVEYFESENLSFINNFINVSSESGYGVYVSDTEIANVSNNTFYYYGSSGAEIIFEAASNSTFSDNNIYLFGGSSYGLAIYDQDDFNISDNFFSISSYSSVGVYISGAVDYTVENNIINLITGDNGIYVQSSDRGLISNQSIAITSDGAVGIYLRESDNHQILDSIILTQSEEPVGIILYSSSNVTIQNNSMDSDSLSSGFTGLFFDSSSNLDVSENNILTYGEYAKGAYVGETSLLSFDNNNISIYDYGGTGIYIYLSDSNNFSGGNILLDTSDSYGLYLSDSNSNKFSDLIIDSLDPDSYPVYVLGNSNFSFFDSLLNGNYSLLIDSSVGNGIWNFTNVPIGEIYSSGSPNYTLNNHWYLDVNVEGIDESVVEGAEVSCTDKDGNLIFDELTGGGGSIDTQSVLSYSRTSLNDIEYYSNFTVNASKDNLSSSHQLNLTGNDEIILSLDILVESSESEEDSNAPVTTGSSGGSGNLIEKCHPVWRCSKWSECIEGKSSRTCENLNSCYSNSPRTEKSCQGEYEIRNILFDIGLELIDNQVPLGKNLSSKVSLLNLGVPGRVNVSVYYEITNKKGDIVQSFEDTAFVETQFEFIKEFNLEGFDEGEYALEASIDYEGQTEPAIAHAGFFIGAKRKFNLVKYLIIVAAVIFLLVAILFFILSRKDSGMLKKMKKTLLLYEKTKDSKREVYESLKKDYKELDYEEKEKIYPRIEDDFNIE